MTTTSIRILVAVDSGLNAAEIADLVPNDTELHTIGVVEGMDETWRMLQDSSVDVLLVACHGHSDRALFLVDGAVKQDPSRPVLVLADGSPNGFVRRAFQAGAADLVRLPMTAENLRFEIQKALARSHGGALAVGAELARLVVVLGPKGGTGKTMTSVNLGVALAKQGQRVVVVDLDLQFGDVALTMGLAPTTTMHDLAVSGGTLDASKIDDFLVTHASGVRVLMGPSRPDEASAISVEFLREVYSILRLNYDFVIVDTPPNFTPEVITAIDNSTEVVIVGMLDTLSLKNTKLGLETLELMSYRRDLITVVLNRAQTKVGITPEDVSAVLGRDPDVLIPSDREIPRVLSEGVPLVMARPQSDASAAFNALAGRLLDGAVEAPAAANASPTSDTRRRIFGRKA